MSVRPFDWRDWPALHRYRHQCLFLDSTRLLTQGPKFVPAKALFSYLAMATGVFTYQSVSNGGSDRVVLLGQVTHPSGSASAKISFLTPAFALESSSLLELLEHLAAEIGSRGATHLLADVDEDDQAFESLRKAGFATYARQRIWQLTSEPAGNDLPTTWQLGKSKDIINSRTLYCNLVPGLVQQVEPPPANRLKGWIYRERNELMAYVDIKIGPAGIWVQPFIHPDMEKVTEHLVNLLNNLPMRKTRPIYIAIRSYQSWLEPAIEEIGAEAGPRQAVMVRHLAVPQKSARAYVIHGLERGHPEITAPIVRRISRKL